MNITAKKRTAIARRLATDEEWGESELGKLCRLMIDTDAVPFSTLARFVEREQTVVHRWVQTVKVPGGNVEETEMLEKKIKQFREALQKALLALEVPQPLSADDLFSAITKYVPEN